MSNTNSRPVNIRLARRPMAEKSKVHTRRAASTISLAAACIVASVAPLAFADDIEVLVKSEDRAPDNTGEFFLLNIPVQRNGNLAFSSSLRDNGFSVGTGVYRAESGSVVQIVREGDPAPDGNGQFGSAGDPDPLINENGQVAFRHQLINTIGGTVDNTAIFISDGSGAPAIVARSGQTPAGSAAILNSPIGQPNGLNRSGDVLFTSTLMGGIRGLFLGDGTPGGLVQLVADGDFVPNGESVDIAGPGNQPPTLNESGEVGFMARLLPLVPRVDALLLADGTNPLVELVREGDPAPSDGSFSELRSTSGAMVSNHPLNDRGEVAFVADLVGTSGGITDNAGLFVVDKSKITEYVRRGDSAPDGNGTFLGFGNRIDLDEDGRVVFEASLTGVVNGATDGLFLADGDTVRQILRRNDPAPGGGVFSDILLGTGIREGQVAFFAFVDLQDGPPANDLEGLFFFDGSTVLEILRVGDTFPGLGVVSDLTLRAALVNEGPEGNAIGHRSVGFDFTSGGNYRLAVWRQTMIFEDGFESGDTSAWSSTVQ